MAERPSDKRAELTHTAEQCAGSCAAHDSESLHDQGRVNDLVVPPGARTVKALRDRKRVIE